MCKILSKVSLTALVVSAVSLTGGIVQAGVQNDDDLVQNWGPWAKIMPAAGGHRTFTPRIGLQQRAYNIRPGQINQTDPEIIDGKPAVIGNEEPAVIGCQPGMPCGFATYYREMDSGDVEPARGAGPTLAHFGLEITDDVPAGGVDYDNQGGDDGIPGTAQFFVTLAGTADPADYPSVTSDVMPGVRYPGDWFEYEYYEDDSEDTYSQVGGGYAPWDMELAGGEYDKEDLTSQLGGDFLTGVASPLDTLETLAAGNVVATYSGSIWGDGYGDVEITIDFAAASWQGSWNSGVDGVVETFVADNGITYGMGQMGFNAAGTVNGVNLVATEITAGDGVIAPESVVEGALVGAEAQTVIGGYDIIKTTEEYDQAHQAGIYYAVE